MRQHSENKMLPERCVRWNAGNIEPEKWELPVLGGGGGDMTLWEEDVS